MEGSMPGISSTPPISMQASPSLQHSLRGDLTTPSLQGPPSQQPLPGKPEFVNLAGRYKCLLCRGVLKNAVQTVCGHRMCEECAGEALREAEGEGKVMECPGQEEDCVKLSKEQIHRDSSARREVCLLPVFCTFKRNGCSQTVKWKDLQNHVQHCDFRDVECPFHVHGCNQKVSLQNIESHKADCEYRLEPCQFCRESIPVHGMAGHEDNVCPEKLIPCPYGCDNDNLPRAQMQDHMLVCPSRPKSCRFQKLGCSFTGKEEELKSHEKSAIDEHLELVTVFAANMDLESMRLRSEMQELTSGNQSMSSLVHDIKSQLSGMRESVKIFQRDMRDIQARLSSQYERIGELEGKLTSLASRELIEKQGREIFAMKNEQETARERINVLERVGPVAGAGGIVNVPERAVVQLQQHDRQISVQDIRLAELDLRFQILETSSYNGVLTWKIKDYRRRKQDAIEERTLSLYSQPFYTSKYGYKMCARVYLNGDGMGRGTHLSLFFVVLKGEYDALLPWPFRQKVTLMLLDQESGIRHLSDSFRPDPNSSSFRRPVTEMNVASGCPLFVSHSVLETNTYCRDDTIFIRIVVDTGGLSV